MGLVAMLLYKDVALGLVMVLAMTLNLMLAALMGVLIPMTMLRFGRDPALGSSVLITAVTDSGRLLHLPRTGDAVPRLIRALPIAAPAHGIFPGAGLFVPSQAPNRLGELP